MLCTDFTLVKHFSDRIDVEPLPCKRWSCPHCAPKRKQRLIREAAHGEPEVLITLTVNPSQFSSPDERARKLKDAWTLARKRACKKYGYTNIPFLAVFERTKRGEPHLHILARVPWIDQSWLSDTMAALISAPIVDIRKIDKHRNVALYVSKYIGKDPRPFEGTKRYWRSLDWLDTETRRKWELDKPACTVEVRREPFFEVAAQMRRVGVVLWSGVRQWSYTVVPWRKRKGPT